MEYREACLGQLCGFRDKLSSCSLQDPGITNTILEVLVDTWVMLHLYGRFVPSDNDAPGLEARGRKNLEVAVQYLEAGHTPAALLLARGTVNVSLHRIVGAELLETARQLLHP